VEAKKTSIRKLSFYSFHYFYFIPIPRNTPAPPPSTTTLDYLVVLVVFFLLPIGKAYFLASTTWRSIDIAVSIMVKACSVCGSRKWRKDPITGSAVCEEGHVLQVSG
jgi:hypothetical protein